MLFLIGEIADAIKFKVYPNPSNGIFNIALDADEAKTASISVKNIVGQTIVDKTINVAGKTKETISLSNYSSGVPVNAVYVTISLVSTPHCIRLNSI